MEEKELVEFIAKRLVDDPDGVEVKIIEGEKSTILELKVNPNDIGKIIGKRGRIASALRTILFATSMKSGKRVMLEIIDNWLFFIQEFQDYTDLMER